MAHQLLLNEDQKVILTHLRRNTGSFLRKTVNYTGKNKYKIFTKEKCAIAWAAVKDVEELRLYHYLLLNETENVLFLNPQKIEEWKAKHLRKG